jgi:two-component system, OmpR family, sensor histidine kinase VicK
VETNRIVSTTKTSRDILKTEFINVAAHELRTPTQSIIGYCEMIEAFPEKKR